MNKLQPYEQLLATKLEQRPIPDMADAIWANIEKGLDANPPSPDSPSHPPTAPSPAGTIKLLSILVVIAAVVIIILLARKKDTGTLPVQPSINTPVAPRTNEEQKDPVSNGNSISRKQNSKLLPHTDSNHAVPGAGISPGTFVDSAKTTPLVDRVPVNVRDSMINIPHSSPSIVPAPKKSKGVPLTDDDYKFVPGDTTKKHP